MHNSPAMRILIADRNIWLLESISRSFAGQFCIQSATTHEQCNTLLRQSQFDLVVISEKLADGPGLQLLGQIVRDSPDTLRVFAARRSRLELLKGKLGPFGLFRTLSYPINPRELHSLLMLSRSGLETEMPAIEVPVAKPAAIQEKVTAPAVKPPEPATPVAVPVIARPSAERISFVRASSLFSTNVLESLTGKPGSGLPVRAKAVPRPIPRETRPSRPAESQPRDTAREVVQSRPAAVQPLEQPEIPPADFFQVVPLQPAPLLRQRSPIRTKVVLGATVVAVFLVTTLTMNLLDASVHVSHAAAPASVVGIEPPPAVPDTPPAAAPVELTPGSSHPAREAQHPVPKPGATEPQVATADSRVAASTTPVADPSTFGSEAYEVVYTN
jgi:hypothetical protein